MRRLQRSLLSALMLAALNLALASTGGGFGGGFSGGGGGGFGGGDLGAGLGGFSGFGFFPFFFGGFGGSFWIILVILIIALNYGRRMRRRGGGIGLRGLGGLGMDPTIDAERLQIMLSPAREIKMSLQRTAQFGDASSNAGLAQMLREAALTLLRHESAWCYGSLVQQHMPVGTAERQVAAWAAEARSLFTYQTTSNYGGYSSGPSGPVSAGGQYLVVTIAIAAGNLPKVTGRADSASIRQTLLALSVLRGGDLLRVEVVWSPDAEGEFLSEDDAIRLYPNMEKL